MKVYIWSRYGVLPGYYGDGCAFALANSVEEARALIQAELNDFPTHWAKFLEAEPSEILTSPTAFLHFGGNP